MKLLNNKHDRHTLDVRQIAQAAVQCRIRKLIKISLNLWGWINEKWWSTARNSAKNERKYL